MTTKAPENPYLVRGVGDLETLNKAADHHFFDADTRRSFSSRILPDVIAHRFFITTERRGFEDPARSATIRMIRDSGAVEDVGEFLHFDTPAKARAALKAARKPLEGPYAILRAAGVTVRFDPYPSDLIAPENGEPGSLTKAAGTITVAGLGERFVWRAYVGDLPIGSRTSLGDAERIALEAATPCERAWRA